MRVHSGVAAALVAVGMASCGVAPVSLPGTKPSPTPERRSPATADATKATKTAASTPPRCVVPNEVVRRGLDNPDLVITSTKCSKVDPTWAELTANYQNADPDVGTAALVYVHYTGGRWNFVAGAFRNDVWCKALRDPTLPSDFRAYLQSRC